MCRLSEMFVVEAVEGGAKVLSHPVDGVDIDQGNLSQLLRK